MSTVLRYYLKAITPMVLPFVLWPCIRPGTLKFELTNQHSADEKNFTILTSQQLCALLLVKCKLLKQLQLIFDIDI